MHELSVAQSILDIAVANAEAQQATRILNIRVVIGALSTYIDDSLKFYWHSLTDGTLAANSTLEFIHDPGTLSCLGCSAEFSTNEPDFRCPQCGGLWTQPLSGQECYVDSIEVECPELV